MADELGGEVKKRMEQGWKEENEEKKETSRPEDIKSKEEKKPSREKGYEKDLPPADFGQFVMGLSMQALIFLGEIPNPVSNKKEKDLKQAQYIINTLDMLKEKTKGNLSKEEAEVFEASLYELRMRYVSLADLDK